MVKYKRRNVEKAIVMALRDLGGSASRKQIRRTIAENEYDGLIYEEVYYTKKTKTGMYSPFLFDFNFGLKNLQSVGYVEKLKRNQDVVLSDLGRSADLTNYPTEEQQKIIAAYWDKKNTLRAERNKAKKITDADKEEAVDSDDEQDSADNDWRTQLLGQIKRFSPAKFESFSRLLISKMGVSIDKIKGVQLSGDHGIDGFGYSRSDEFRTSRVAIQCKRYTSGAVGESEIRDFKGTMDSFNAEYGIFVTTSYYTDTAKKIAIQGNRTVTLIDGQELTDLIEKYQLHIKPVTTYALDDYYFEKD
ncbi:restriction endonuclease [Lactobacillus helveticus]|uniref:restriction endonuclease n=1 Tax=Lactobacillus helveticus TaxID=1587 RepID=UPI0030D29B83